MDTGHWNEFPSSKKVLSRIKISTLSRKTTIKNLMHFATLDFHGYYVTAKKRFRHGAV